MKLTHRVQGKAQDKATKAKIFEEQEISSIFKL